MTGEMVGAGELVVTSGGDQIFPKGLPVGTVMKVSPGADLFLNIRVKPAVNLNQLEEVLVITKKEDRAPSLAETNSVRAVDILTQRLPSVPDKPVVEPIPPPAGEAAAPATNPQAAAAKLPVKAGNSPTGSPKPATSSKSVSRPEPTKPQPAKLESKPDHSVNTGAAASAPATTEDKPQ